MCSHELCHLFQELQTSDEHHSALWFRGGVFWEACKIVLSILTVTKKIIFGCFFAFFFPWKYTVSSCTHCTLSSQHLTLEQLLCLGWSLFLCKHNFIGQIGNPISNHHLHYFLWRYQCTQYSCAVHGWGSSAQLWWAGRWQLWQSWLSTAWN